MWVQIEKIILKADERTAKLPEDTQKCDYIMRLNGFLHDGEAKIGNNVKIKTLTNRIEEGTLIKINPPYEHNFGRPVEELMHIGPVHKKMLEEGKDG